MEQGPTFRVTCRNTQPRIPIIASLPPAQPLYPLLFLHPRRNLGPVGDAGRLFLPFQTTYYLNGHSFIEQELNRAQVGFRKSDNAFLAVDDVTALQEAADRRARTSFANASTTGR